MLKLTRRIAVAGALAAAVGGLPAEAQNQPIRIAFGDIPSVESLHFLIARGAREGKGRSRSRSRT